jgi:hypothetical protein
MIDKWTLVAVTFDSALIRLIPCRVASSKATDQHMEGGSVIVDSTCAQHIFRLDLEMTSSSSTAYYTIPLPDNLDFNIQ